MTPAAPDRAAPPTPANEYVPTTAAPAPSASASRGASPSPSASASSASAQVLYPAGSIATANQGADGNGSQFFIFYKDSPMPPTYTLFGTVTAGLDIVSQVAAAGDDGAFANDEGAGGHPKKEITIQTLTVGPASSSSAAPSATPTPSAKS